MCDLAHYLCTCGEPMRRYIPRHPASLCDFTRVFNSGAGRKVCTDAKGVCLAAANAASVMAQVALVKTLRYTQAHRSSWRQHQSKTCEQLGYCESCDCPGQGIKRWRPRETNMRCEECSEMLGRDVFLCNGTAGLVDGGERRWKVLHCHEEFHNSMCNKK